MVLALDLGAQHGVVADRGPGPGYRFVNETVASGGMMNCPQNNTINPMSAARVKARSGKQRSWRWLPKQDGCHISWLDEQALSIIIQIQLYTQCDTKVRLDPWALGTPHEPDGDFLRKSRLPSRVHLILFYAESLFRLKKRVLFEKNVSILLESANNHRFFCAHCHPRYVGALYCPIRGNRKVIIRTKV